MTRTVKIIAAIAVVALAAASYGVVRAKRAEVPAGKNGAPVAEFLQEDLHIVSPQALERTLPITGSLVPFTEATVKAKVAGELANRQRCPCIHAIDGEAIEPLQHAALGVAQIERRRRRLDDIEPVDHADADEGCCSQQADQHDDREVQNHQRARNGFAVPQRHHLRHCHHHEVGRNDWREPAADPPPAQVEVALEARQYAEWRQAREGQRCEAERDASNVSLRIRCRVR